MLHAIWCSSFHISRYLAPSSCSCCTGTLGSPPAPLESPRSSCTDPDDTSSQPRQPPPLPSQPPPLALRSLRLDLRHIVSSSGRASTGPRRSVVRIASSICLFPCLLASVSFQLTLSQVKSSHGKTLSQTVWLVGTSKQLPSLLCLLAWSVPVVCRFN